MIIQRPRHIKKLLIGSNERREGFFNKEFKVVNVSGHYILLILTYYKETYNLVWYTLDLMAR